LNLNGWQAVACLAIAGGLGVAGAFVPNPTATVGLFNLASGIVAGTFALLQRSRDPHARTRSSDRTSTAAGGVPTYDRTPPPETPRRP